MQRMKESGKLGGTGMMNDMNVGGSLEGSKTNGTAASGEWFESNGQWFQANAEAAVVRPVPPTTPAVSPPPISSEAAEAATAAPTEELEAADRAEDLLEDGRPKSTASVGGRWVQPQEVDKLEKLKPSVGSWGVFERPADISKAYGGGKKIGVGGFEEDEEERKRKAAAIDAKLKSYRKSLGGDYEAEKEHEVEITAARKESSQLSRMGELKGALNVLLAVEPWLCDGTELGGRTLLELGWAYDATGNRDMGRRIMGRLRKSPSKEIRRMSQQLAFQDEASDFLGVKDFGTDGPSEYEKLSRLPRVKGIKRYNLLDAPIASFKRPPVDSLSEARMTLRSAAVRRSDNGAPTRLQQSLTFIAKQGASPNASEPLLPEGGAEGASSLLRGTWSLALTARGGKVSWAPREARLELSLGGGGGALQGTFERLAPGGGPGLFRTTGSVAVKPGARAPVLQLEAEECRLGPLPVPLMTRTTTERLLFLDGTMCVAEASSGDVTVLVRPKLQADPNDGE